MRTPVWKQVTGAVAGVLKRPPSGRIYSYRSTNAGDIGAGVLDRAFFYPWQYPAVWFAGPGVTPFGIMRIAQGNPAYYQQRMTDASILGAGTMTSEPQLAELQSNFYNSAANTAYF